MLMCGKIFLMNLTIKMAGKYQVDDVFYLIGKVAFVPVILFGFWFARNGFINYGGLFECEMRRISGFPCPGCGGTRAFYHLFRGEIAQSFRLNPIVIYGAAAYLHFMLMTFVKRRIGKKIENEARIQYYLYGAVAVLLLQWLIKVVRMVYHFYLIY